MKFVDIKKKYTQCVIHTILAGYTQCVYTNVIGHSDIVVVLWGFCLKKDIIEL